jgi:hypothetical protein
MPGKPRLDDSARPSGGGINRRMWVRCGGVKSEFVCFSEAVRALGLALMLKLCQERTPHLSARVPTRSVGRC